MTHETILRQLTYILTSLTDRYKTNVKCWNASVRAELERLKDDQNPIDCLQIKPCLFPRHGPVKGLWVLSTVTCTQFNALSPNSDGNEISLYIITTCWNTQVMRIKKVMTNDKMPWYLDIKTNSPYLLLKKCNDNRKENMHFYIRAWRVKHALYCSTDGLHG